MNTKTPITDSCVGSADRFGDRDVIPATVARKLEGVALTISEGHLVKHLLELWDTIIDEGRCKSRCECAVCKAMEESGNHNVSTFASLKEKAETSMR